MAEPSAAQLDADWGASGRRQSCSAEQKPEPAGEKGAGGRSAGQPVSKLVFATTSRARLGSFLRTSDRSGHEDSWCECEGA